MSTPAVITLRNACGPDHDDEVDIAHIYRHWDGYPAVCGKDIATAVLVAARRPPRDRNGLSCPTLTNRNWAQHVLAALCMCDADLEFLDEDRLPGSAYAYTVIGDYDDFGGLGYLDEKEFLRRIRIECRRDSAGVFLGGVEAFSAWCEDYRF